MTTPTEPDPTADPGPTTVVVPHAAAPPTPAGWDDALRMAFAVDSTDAERLVGVAYLLELDPGAEA